MRSKLRVSAVLVDKRQCFASKQAPASRASISKMAPPSKGSRLPYRDDVKDAVRAWRCKRSCRRRRIVGPLSF